VFKYYRTAQKSLLQKKKIPWYCIRNIVTHLLLPSSFARLSEKKKIVTKIVRDGTAFGFHVEDGHRRKIREWEKDRVKNDDEEKTSSQRRNSGLNEDLVFVEFMLAKWEYCMLEMGKSDPRRVLQAAQAFSVAMGLEDHFYTMGNRHTDICQEITSKLTAPGRNINSQRRIRKLFELPRMIPKHVAPEPPRRPTILRIDHTFKYDSLNSIRNRMQTYIRKFKKKDTSQMGVTLLRGILSKSSSSTSTTKSLRSPNSSGDRLDNILLSPRVLTSRSKSAKFLRSSRRLVFSSESANSLLPTSPLRHLDFRSKSTKSMRSSTSPPRRRFRRDDKVLLSPGEKGTQKFRETLRRSSIRRNRSSSVSTQRRLSQRRRSSTQSIGLPPGLVRMNSFMEGRLRM